MNSSEQQVYRRLPYRPHSHTLGDRAERFVVSRLPSEWIVRKVSYDYGLDLNVEIVRDHTVTGMSFSVQVKGLTKDSGSTNDILVRLKMPSVNYMCACLEPVILVVFVEQLQEAFWCWETEIPKGHGDSVTARVHKHQSLSAINWDSFALAVQRRITERPTLDFATSERLARFGRYSIDLGYHRLLFREEVDELELLVSKEQVREQELQAFIERHPEVFLGGEYIRMYGQVRLECSETILIPDFLLEHVSGFCDIMELKLPTVRVVTGKPTRRRLSMAVYEAAAQTRVYRDFFDEKDHRDWFEKKYVPLCSFKPRTLLLIGRDKSFGNAMEKRKLELSLGDYRILTYDDLLRIARTRQVE